jgi:hypothetical protein
MRGIMKQNILVSIILALFISCATKKAPELEPKADINRKEVITKPDYLWVFKPNINVRSDNSPSSSKLTQLSDGDSVIVLKNENGWYQIKTTSDTTGWIRTDLLGPRNLSAFSKAVTFVDSLREAEEIEIFFDKNLYHKRIYISYPPRFYTTKSAVEAKTKLITDDFQRRVYRGKVNARVLQPGNKEEYLAITVPGETNADPILPVVPYGILRKVTPKYANGISLEYETPDDISDEQILATARNLSERFPLTYPKIEITFFDTSKNCRLWFVEDSNGENFKFDACP